MEIALKKIKSNLKRYNYYKLINYFFVFLSLINSIQVVNNTKSEKAIFLIFIFQLSYTIAIFEKHEKKKMRFFLAVLSYVSIFMTFLLFNIDYIIFYRIIFSLPLLYAFLLNKVTFPIIIGLLCIILFEKYNVEQEMLLNNVISMIIATISETLIVRLTYNLIKSREQFRFLSVTDQLTGVLNRRGFYEKIQKRLDNDASKISFLFIDLDRFKNVNDTLGHKIGDRLLIEVTNSIKNVLRKEDLISRMGGDEFVICLDTDDKDEVEKIVRRIHSQISKDYIINDKDINISSSIGIAIFKKHANSISELLQKADIAMYQAKKQARDYIFYSFEMEQRINENQLHLAYKKEQFYLVYQPQYSIEENKIVGVEALIRWQHPIYGVVSPVEFIPLAEETRLIIPIGEWVLKEACMKAKEWQIKGYEPINMSVNISIFQLLKTDFVEKVKDILEDVQLEPKYLTLEIVESIKPHYKDIILTTLTQLKQLGIKIAIDDYGTGYSSINYIKNYPIDFLKIDRSFISGISLDEKDKIIVSSTIAMAHLLNITVIGEGVEQDIELDFLKNNQCDMVQGYYTGRPCMLEEIENKLIKI
ncbi:MAG: putative bifunctional diguanylate cyclase/phosphodiesterase [Halanaerobiaceae bacterium]